MSVTAALRASHISHLLEGLNDPLLPYHTHEFRSLFSKEKMKISEYFGILETPGKLDEAPSQTIGRSECVTSEHSESFGKRKPSMALLNVCNLFRG